MMKSKLAQTTFELLEATAADDWRRIADTTGLKFAWIRQFALGHISEPGASKLEALYCALTDEPLTICRETVDAE